MAQKQMIKTAGSLDGEVALGDIMGTIEVALNQGMPMDSRVRIEHDQTFHRDFLTITHDPSHRRVSLPLKDNLTPVEQAIQSEGDRFLSLGFIQSNDVRKPIQIRIEVQDDATGVIMTSLDLDEHQFARLLAGGVLKVKDSR